MASKNVIIGSSAHPVRLSFPRLFEPEELDNGGQKWSTKLLIPKADKDALRKLQEMQRQALEQGNSSGKFGSRKLKGEPGTGQKWDTIHDGDESDYAEDAGCWTIGVSSYRRPGIVDRNVQPILDADEVYSGCYVRVSLSCYPYNSNGNQGVTFGLGNVQKLADGEPLDGSSRAEDDFDALDDDEDDVL